MESKLKNKNFHFEFGLNTIQKEAEHEIINLFEEKIKDMPLQILIQKWRSKLNLLLISVIEESLDIFKKIAEHLYSQFLSQPNGNFTLRLK
jgi:hypothetical protein